MTARVVITGAGGVCGAGRDPDAMLDAIMRRPLGDRARSQQWDTTGWPVHASRPRSPTSIARALVDDRKLHKLIRRTDCSGIYAADRAIEARGLSSRIATRSTADASRAFSDRTGVYVGSGGGEYENQYDYFPLMTEANGDLPAFGRELADTVNPMWLLRTLPNNVLGHVGIRNGLKGANACITNHSVGGALAVIEAIEALRTRRGGPRGRGRARHADRAADACCTTTAAGCSRATALRPFDARARRQPVRRRRRRAGARDRSRRARTRNAPVLGEVLGGGYAGEALGLLAIRDDGDGLARAIDAALDDAALAPARHRHDRRARQRHAAVRRLRSGGAAARVRRRDARRSPRSSGRSAT